MTSRSVLYHENSWTPPLLESICVPSLDNQSCTAFGIAGSAAFGVMERTGTLRLDGDRGAVEGDCAARVGPILVF